MARLSLILVGVSCVVLFLLQLAFIFIEPQFILTFTQIIRQFVYFVLAAVVFFFVGRSKRPVRKAYQANIVAVCTVFIFFAMIVFVSFFFGGGRNIMTPSIGAVLRNLWIFAVPVLLGEYIRFKLIKNSPDTHRLVVLVVLTLVFAFANLSNVRQVAMSGFSLADFLFESVLPALTISAVLSYMSIRGTYVSVAVVSFVLILGNTFSPFLPIVDVIVWALLISVLAFAVGVLFYYLTDDSSAAQRKRLNRAAKYSGGNPVRMFLSIVFMGLVIAFFLNVFPVYPVVILTGSMTGTINRGSLVVMRRIPANEVLHRVQVGDILHYNEGRHEFVHRVIDFYYNSDGIREFITKGDANEFPDRGTLLQEDVIGTPVFTVPFIGYPNVVFRAMTGGFF